MGKSLDWREEGILLTIRRHGENSAIIEAFTRAHGRHSGVVRGGTSRKLTPVLQPGNQLDLTWRARLEDHLGTYSVEPIKARAGAVLSDATALAGLNAACALLSFALPEREPHTELYDASHAFFDVLGADKDWPVAYLHWEVALLADLGFSMDFEHCAATGKTDDLIYVSPRTGRAVSASGAAGYEDRLLPLPGILKDPRSGDPSGVREGLKTTGHFLKTGLASNIGKELPTARQRLLDRLSRPKG